MNVFSSTLRKAVGLFLPASLVLATLSSSCSRSESGRKPADVEYYTCTMHPSVKKQNPNDKCPICSMDLVPVKKKGANAGQGHGQNENEEAKSMPGKNGKGADAEKPSEFSIPVQRQQEYGVTYAMVEKKPLKVSLRVAGLVDYDKLRNWDIVTRIEGYVDKLFVASKGELVEKNQQLVTVYSPELLTTQREFFDLLKSRDEAKRAGTGAASESLDALIESAKVRMRLWNLNDQQIEELERTRKAQVYITLYSPARGLVRSVQVTQGRKVMPGDYLVEVTDLSMVWVWAEFYQEELPLLEKNLPIKVSTSAYPGEAFKGKIAVIDPFLNAAKRVIRVRVDVENPDLKLRPDMFVDIELDREMGQGLSVPFSAIIPTGRRNIAFVDKGEGRLEPRLVELGRKFGDAYQVLSGLKEGERVVASANFLIDAEAKVQGAVRSW